MDDNKWEPKGNKIETKNKIEPQQLRCSLIDNIDFGFSGEEVGGDRDVYYAKRAPFHGNVSTRLSVIVWMQNFVTAHMLSIVWQWY